MAQFITVPALVDAWRVPDWGQVADEPAPSWLVEALLTRTLTVNHLGGLTLRTEADERACYCGDYVIRAQDGAITFMTSHEFKQSHERIRHS